MPFDISVLQTGAVRVRQSQLTQPATSVILRRLRFLLDRTWSDPLPIYAFLISHPEGYILYDTGETPRVNEPGYFPWYQLGHHFISMEIELQHSLETQLRARGVDPQTDIKAVVLSHLHSDHAGGLADVIQCPVIYTSKEHWDVFRHCITANFEGANPQRWPSNFAPKMLAMDGPPIGPFRRSGPVTEDGKVVAVDTPGHVPGHLSLIIFDEHTTYFLTGDSTYNLQLLDEERTDGINTDPSGAIETLLIIKEFCRQYNVVVLPSHDPNTVKLLKEKTIYKPKGPAET